MREDRLTLNAVRLARGGRQVTSDHGAKSVNPRMVDTAQFVGTIKEKEENYSRKVLILLIICMLQLNEARGPRRSVLLSVVNKTVPTTRLHLVEASITQKGSGRTK